MAAPTIAITSSFTTVAGSETVTIEGTWTDAEDAAADVSVSAIATSGTIGTVQTTDTGWSFRTPRPM